MQYSSEREEAIKRVPANVSGMLQDLDKKIAEQKAFCIQLQDQLPTKLGIEEYKTLMSQKLDVSVFEKWFPPSQGEDPKAFFKSMMTGEVDLL